MEFNEIYKKEYPRLSIAIATGDANVFNRLVKLRKGLKVKDNRGRIPLHEAAEYGREDFVNTLLKFGNKGSVNCRSYEGETPLFLACKFHNSVSLVRALVTAGANVDIGNNEGVTPLHIACGLARVAVAQALVELDADVNAKDMNEFTPLHTAVENNFDFVTCLITHGADPSLQDIFGRTPIFLAVQYADVTVIKSLLMAGVDVNKPAYDGVTPFMMAAQRGILEHLDLLLEYGADPNIEANDNLMAIHLALGVSDHEPAVKRLLEVTDKNAISANIKKIPGYSLEFLALENSTVSYLNILLGSKQQPEVTFQPIWISDYLRVHDDGLFNFECCEVVMNAKFTTVSFLAYFVCRFYTSDSFSEMLEYILKCGCPVAVEDKKCYPPILAAVHLPSSEVALYCISTLARHGVNVDYCSSDSACPDILISALKHSDAEVILHILKLSSFATLDDIVSLAIRGSCRANKVIPLVEVLGGASPSVFEPVSAVDSPACNALQLFTPRVCSLQTLCRTALRKYFFRKYRNCNITDICQRLRIPKLLVSYLKYENCEFPKL
ncbi:ankyrin repeat and SOCS box protein 3-like [Bacillus rossius redtenbacheri]|uniref:ankyrin repeat and SOCS box protein 3-like n=1 Tax=Bacillus rossius redtenbacheri TaxID=93214 RepID=UPI002FDD5262